MKQLSIALALAAWLLAGCASAPWDDDGRAHRAQQQPEQVKYAGVVESVREVQIDSERTGVGSMTGAVISDGRSARVTR